MLGVTWTGLRGRMLPEAQRRTLEELTSELDLTVGDARSKQSAFWTMLTLSAVIASAGVLADSTATVIGAMIIAPLSTPIMGIALAVVKREKSRSVRFVLLGALLVVGAGALFSVTLPGSYDLLGNSQIAGRTSPGALDLIGAVATGLAGAVALARRDVAAVLPGVAIAISLVPPLAVVGVCLGQGDLWLAAGALLLFLSNLLALVLAGTLVFTALGYAAEAVVAAPGRPRRKAYVTVTLLLFVVALPLLAQSAVTYAVTVWTARVETAATEWVAKTPDASVTRVELVSTTFHVHVKTPGGVPPVEQLLTDLRGRVPDGVAVVVDTTLGRKIDAGSVGEG